MYCKVHSASYKEYIIDYETYVSNGMRVMGNRKCIVINTRHNSRVQEVDNKEWRLVIGIRYTEWLDVFYLQKFAYRCAD